MVLAGLASFLLVAFPSAAAAPLIYRFCVLNYFLIFENLIPLLELDGYFILAEAIEVPDLRDDRCSSSSTTCGTSCAATNGSRNRTRTRRIRRDRRALHDLLDLRRDLLLGGIFGSMIGALWRGGPGSRMLLLVLALFLAGPAIRGLIALGRTTARRLRGLWRRLKFRFETSGGSRPPR